MPELGIAIWLVNVINGVFSFCQEFRASKASEALKKMLPANARVVRDGNEMQILAEDLVPGDIMLIEEGDKISADARLLSSSDLQVNQSTLNGESNPVRKMHDADLKEDVSRFEIPNLIFAGTSVASGTARAVVTKIGMQTEFGRIAKLTQATKEEKSPLQKELDILTKQISVIAIAIGVAFFVAAVFFVKQPIRAGVHLCARHDRRVHSGRPAADRHARARHGRAAHGEGTRAREAAFRSGNARLHDGHLLG